MSIHIRPSVSGGYLIIYTVTNSFVLLSTILPYTTLEDGSKLLTVKVKQFVKDLGDGDIISLMTNVLPSAPAPSFYVSHVVSYTEIATTKTVTVQHQIVNGNAYSNPATSTVTTATAVPITSPLESSRQDLTASSEGTVCDLVDSITNVVYS